MSVLQKLTEGIASRNLQREGAALLEKWESTGLLEGLDGDYQRQGMARLLENQAAQLLKEASAMSAGDVEGFASVAFPIVRRVFGGLVANNLVSVQPMSLPSGLIFFLDFTASTPNGATLEDNDSLYGGGVVGHQITGGVDLGYVSSADMSATGDHPDEGFYNLNHGYSSVTGSSTLNVESGNEVVAHAATIDLTNPSEAERRLLRFDPDVLGLGGGHEALVLRIDKEADINVDSQVMDEDKLMAVEITVGGSESQLNHAALVRRLTCLGSSANHPAEPDWNGETSHLYVTYVATDNDIPNVVAGAQGTSNFSNNPTISFAMIDNMNGTPNAGSGQDGIGIVAMGTPWGLENTEDIPEIDIRVDSFAVTAVTKKLKAKWTPELGQDLNAYHNLDAEVELTQILSEQIALEIDREILSALVQGATAATYYWSRSPGLFVNRETGAELGATAASPDFTGTVSEWYETLIETIN
ncbi:MAG TPA: hypothetical protein DCW74_04070, partial [Alteromonas australica]|nr:hypothetical protein [Alteromonas australica]